MKTELKFFLLIFVCFSSCDAFELKCEFQFEKWSILGTVYTCHVQELVLTKNVSEPVTNVTGNHLEGKTSEDVLKLNIQGQVCVHLPSNVEKFFPNLQGIRIAKSGLRFLEQSDLSVFPKLRSCDAWEDAIEELSSDLFEKNPEIQYLYLGYNKIRKVGQDLLKPLKNLTKAIFHGNVCIDKSAEYVGEIKELQEALNRQCHSRRFETSSNSDEIEYNLHSEEDSQEWRRYQHRMEQLFEAHRKEMEIRRQAELKKHQEELLQFDQKRIQEEQKRIQDSANERSLQRENIKQEIRKQKADKLQQEQKKKQEEEVQKERKKQKDGKELKQEDQDEKSLKSWIAVVFVLLVMVPITVFLVRRFYNVRPSRAGGLVESGSISYNEMSNDNFCYKSDIWVMLWEKL